MNVENKKKIRIFIVTVVLVTIELDWMPINDKCLLQINIVTNEENNN